MYRPRNATITTLLSLVLSLAFAQHSAAQQLVLTPFKPGSIYALGEKAGWNVTLLCWRRVNCGILSTRSGKTIST